MSAVIGLVLTLVPEPVRTTGAVSWTLPASRADLALSTTSPVGMSVRESPVRHLDSPVDTVAVTAPGQGTAVDVRGLRSDGTWSEWVGARPGAAAVLPEATTSVQTRLALTAGARPRAIDVTAWRAPGRRMGAMTPAQGTTFRIFATREGLVGGTTANGHVITERDHFVALPSRRGLASRGSGNYTVKVCTTDGARCEWAPVWDVGPWNTRDDHWNAERDMWPGLPHGKPQAQAAYQDGHNGGRDQFGRVVRNPAGIDLADGTFWDGLRLPTNAWVDVTYQWTGHGPWGTVETGGWQLNVRTGPSLDADRVGYAARHAQVRIDCAATGDRVRGTQGATARWYRLAPGMYVSAAYVRPGLAAAPCRQP
ncbi:hypothetical protein [Prauserella muralis]|uniref:hypothetical protein n=1 Tax=Prauserella muralis TaxID=588067 RepID=UPI0011AD5972|nr:hypothetical protein [Prauserella muralis]TWE13517.1 hypothetical protein FHX69_5640 [Prauserella muralis]